MNKKIITWSIVGALCIGTLLFCWFQLRPMQIKKFCYKESRENVDFFGQPNTRLDETDYNNCLKKFGL